MFKITPVLKFFGLFLCCYLILVAIFSVPGIQDLNGEIYRSSTNVILNILLPKAYIHVGRNPEQVKDPNAARVLLANQVDVDQQIAEATKNRKTNLRLSYEGFKFGLLETWTLPLIFILSLTLVTPIRPRQKINAVLWSILLVFLLSQLKLYLYTRYYMALHEIGVYELSPFWFNLMEWFKYHFSIGTIFSLTLLIWILVAFRHSNWKTILKDLSGHVKAKAEK